jgi:outer membrane protein assembly factor BamE (lipoprotein component of BamABCDE complex)
MHESVWSTTARTLLVGLWIISVTALAGCSPTFMTHGHRIDDEALARIEPGRTSRDEVLGLLGSPSSLATFDANDWYYVSQRTERKSFYQSDVIEQQVVTVSFDDAGMVEAVEQDTLADARAVDLVERETPTEGNEFTILEQFIGNVGRFNLPETEPR